MGETGITEKILLNTITRFERSELGNAATAKLLSAGIAGGKLQNTAWIVPHATCCDGFSSIHTPVPSYTHASRQCVFITLNQEDLLRLIA